MSFRAEFATLHVCLRLETCLQELVERNPATLMLKGHIACCISVLPSPPEAGALKFLVMSGSARCSVLPSPGGTSYRCRFPALMGDSSGSQ